MTALLRTLAFVIGATFAVALAADELRGTGDLGIVIERTSGAVAIIDTSKRGVLARVEGLGDMSHASAVFSRDQRYAFVFGRDGGLTKLDLLRGAIVGRVVQAGNAIGGAISDDGTLVAVSNYTPGGVRVFDAETLAPVADIPAIGADGKASKTVGLVDLPGRRFAYTLYDAGEIWIADFAEGRSARAHQAHRHRASCPMTATSRPMAVTISRACSARTRRARRSVARAARRRAHPRRLWPRRGEASRSTRCRIWKDGPLPAASCCFRPSAATS
jgi:hypothetical protein